MKKKTSRSKTKRDRFIDGYQSLQKEVERYDQLQELRKINERLQKENLEMAEKLAKLDAIRKQRDEKNLPETLASATSKLQSEKNLPLALEPYMYVVSITKDEYRSKAVFEGTLEDCYLYVKGLKGKIGQSFVNKITSTKRMIYLNGGYLVWIQ